MLGEELRDQGADFPVVVDHEKMGLLVHGRYYRSEAGRVSKGNVVTDRYAGRGGYILLPNALFSRHEAATVAFHYQVIEADVPALDDEEMERL